AVGPLAAPAAALQAELPLAVVRAGAALEVAAAVLVRAVGENAYALVAVLGDALTPRARGAAHPVAARIVVRAGGLVTRVARRLDAAARPGSEGTPLAGHGIALARPGALAGL